MALVATKWVVSVSLADAAGDTTVMHFKQPASALHDDIVGDITDLLATLPGVSELTVKGYSYGKHYVESTYAGVGAGESAGIASLSVLTNNNKPAVMRIPGPHPDIFVAEDGPNMNIVNTNDSDLGAYLGLFTAGWEVSDGEHYASLVSGKRIHRRTTLG